MINVVCFCGCAYSFADAIGTCPQCGERVSSARGVDAGLEQTGEQIDRLLTQLAIKLPPDELAA
jgi:hypothetical protein